ncbi:MAG: hypothetical protein OEV30_09370 [Ignavibacteria bacterium]|nr:hypothetical protein [Ignavibacteria bacterium]
MTLADFIGSADHEDPPGGISGPLLGLWYDRAGEWDKAHEVVQSDGSDDAAWVHAYLHRKEGDLSNAAYWYGRAGRSHPPAEDPGDEWKSIAEDLLNRKK